MKAVRLESEADTYVDKLKSQLKTLLKKPNGIEQNKGGSYGLYI